MKGSIGWIGGAGHRVRAFLTLLRTRRGAALALAALIGLHVALNVLWLRLDEHVIRIDEEFHASAAQDYYFALTDPNMPGLGDRLRAFASIESPYPPALHVLGALTALVFGYSPDTISFSGTLCFALVIWGTYRVARRIYARPAALFAAAVTSLIPILYGGSRYVALENLMAVLSVWGLYFLLASGGFRRWRYVVLFSLANGLAILTKPNAFVYYLLPAAVVYAAGLWAAARAGGTRAVYGHLARALVCLALTGVVGLPWYFYHRASLEAYWMSEHKGGKTPFTFTQGEAPAADRPTRLLEDRIKNPMMQGATHETRAPRATVNTGEIPVVAAAVVPPEATPPPTGAGWTIDVGDVLARREWATYPIMLVNNGLFLPLTVLGLIGLFVGAVRFRGAREFWLIVLWLVGSYVLNTVLFRYMNPRYTMPFVAVFGICVAGLPHALHGRRLRTALAVGVLGLLALQYVNISFVGFDRLNSWVPVLQEHFRVKYFRDQGLTLTKSEVITGTYCFRAPQRGENYVDRGFRAMIEHERKAGGAPGRAVNYISISRQNNFGGFRNLESTYWPEPNPLLRDDLRGKPERQFRFTRIARCNVAAEAVEAIRDADYVVATLDQTVATTGEGPRHIFFQQIRALAPMEMVDFFFVPGHGLLPPAMIGIFALGAENRYGELADLRGQEAGKPEDELFMNAIRLLAMRADVGGPGGLTPEQIADCDARLASLAPHLKGAMRVSPSLELVNLAFDQPFSGWYRLRLLFKVLEKPRHDWRIFVSGSFDAEVARRVPPDIRAQKFFSWNFDPDRPTSTWEPGEFVLCTREFHCPPVPLRNISIGFFRNDSEGWGQSISTGPINFENFPVNESAIFRE